MPEMVSIVTGNQTARAINPIAEAIPDGESTNASGTQAVAGIGPITFSKGMPQYRPRGNQPMQTSVTKATMTPNRYPETKSKSECHVLSKSNLRSSIKLCSTAAGPGK